MRNMILFFSFSLVPFCISAQPVRQLQVGARIEVTPTRGATSTGTFSSFSNGSLSFVLNDATATAVVLPLSEIRAIRVSEGSSRSSGSARGALIGSLAGVVAGAIVGAATTPKPAGDCMLDCSRTQSMVFAGLFYGGVGLVGGTIVGAIAKRESWRPVDLRRMK